MGVGGDLFWLGGDGWGSVGMSGGRWGMFLARWGSVGVGGGEWGSVGNFVGSVGGGGGG